MMTVKKIILFTSILFSSSKSFCQIDYPYQDIKLEKPSDYVETEPMALSAANFLLNTPFENDDFKRTNAIKFLTNWIQGAKGYNFYTQGVAEQLKTDLNLLMLFIAAMVKYNLEHKGKEVNSLVMEKEICIWLLNYTDNPANHFTIKKKLRKILENAKQ